MSGRPADTTLPWRGIGYVGVGAPDPAAWRTFATEVCGLVPAQVLPGPRPRGVPEPAPEARGIAPDGSLYLKMDARQWRIAVHPAEEPGLRYVGLELPGSGDVSRALDRLSAHGIEIRAGSEEECTARGVGHLAILNDPAGHRLELFATPLEDGEPDPSRGVGFLTGGLGMGHVVLFVSDLEGALDFYLRVLGFRRSDYMTFGPDASIHFLRCTPRHHSIALLKVGPASGLQHLMLEMRTLDQVGLALDRALAASIPIRSGLGRHRNDGTVSFYMQGPSGFDVEIGWDGRLVGDDWVDHEFTGEGDLWGHHGLTAESLESGED
ncbi:MAG TPA: glyoxalase [Deltaproteobacteria bacterium]|nr:glyoxalase [Deltaproteobacteria bacterium]